MKTLAIVALLLAGMAALAHADDDDKDQRKQGSLKVDTEHIFGFTEGSDIGEVGDKEIEKETSARFGKRVGLYAASSTLFDFKYVPSQGLLISPGALISYHGISGVPGLDDRQQITLQGFQFELKYQLLNRERAPFGLTLFAQPRWTRIDEASGERVSQFGSEFTLALDKEILPERLFGAVNLIYEPEISQSHETGEQERESGLGISAALAAQVLPGFLIGAETRYLRAHEGLVPGTLKGEALFFGPTLYTRLSPDTFMSIAWNAQVAGRASGEPGRLDLTNFDRNRVRLRLGLEF
ncbi:MAG: hypothetical protein WDO17_27900 [Alphaproteobacteria bacterium]